MGLYPYTYSVGLVAATALAEKSNRDGPAVFAPWLDVLRAGGTLPPLDLMRRVGIDLSSPQPIRDAVAYVGRLIEELEASFSSAAQAPRTPAPVLPATDSQSSSTRLGMSSGFRGMARRPPHE